MSIIIQKDVRSLRGGSLPRLMRGDDGNYYIVKFCGNPQGTSVLVNELLACHIGQRLGLPMVQAAPVYVPPEVARDIFFEDPAGRKAIEPGWHCGIRTIAVHLEENSFDNVPNSFWPLVHNREAVDGVRVFDLWTSNLDSRQFIFNRRGKQTLLEMRLIDNGHCFGGPRWRLSAMPLWLPRGLQQCSLRKWLKKIDSIQTKELFALASAVPRCWIEDCPEELEKMLEELELRRQLLHPMAQAAASGEAVPQMSYLREELLRMAV